MLTWAGGACDLGAGRPQILRQQTGPKIHLQDRYNICNIDVPYDNVKYHLSRRYAKFWVGKYLLHSDLALRVRTRTVFAIVTKRTCCARQQETDMHASTRQGIDRTRRIYHLGACLLRRQRRLSFPVHRGGPPQSLLHRERCGQRDAAVADFFRISRLCCDPNPGSACVSVAGFAQRSAGVLTALDRPLSVEAGGAVFARDFLVPISVRVHCRPW